MKAKYLSFLLTVFTGVISMALTNPRASSLIGEYKGQQDKTGAVCTVTIANEQYYAVAVSISDFTVNVSAAKLKLDYEIKDQNKDLSSEYGRVNYYQNSGKFVDIGGSREYETQLSMSWNSTGQLLDTQITFTHNLDIYRHERSTKRCYNLVKQ
jgi:hypothetical protein